MDGAFTATALQQLGAAAAAGGSSGLLEDFFFFQFADLVTDKLTVATEAYWVHSQNISSAAGLYAHT